MKILYAHSNKLPGSYTELMLGKLRGAFPEDRHSIERIQFSASATEWIEKLERAEVALFTPSTYLSDGIMEAARNIKLIQLLSSGYDKFNAPACKKWGIHLANNGGANANAVAEHTLLLMLAVLRKMSLYHERMKKGLFKNSDYGMDVHSFRGSTVGIIGYGAIGRAVAEKSAALGASILAYDKKKIENGAPQVELDTLLAASDIVTVHIRPDGTTKHFMGRREFSLMKPGAIFVNTARPELVDDAALAWALQTKRLFGAGLDVWYDKRHSPLLSLPLVCNVMATPHISGSTKTAYTDCVNFAVENFKRVERGEMSLGLVSL